MRDRPHPRQDQEHQRIDEDGVGHGEEANRSGAEHERGDRHEGVGGVKVAAEQEPADDGAEPASREPPFVQNVEVGAAPMSGHKADDRHNTEQDDEDDDGNPVHRAALTRSSSKGK
jgi:hypothetical protein